MHWFYRPEDTCLLVDKNMVKQKAKELARADLAAWTKEKARCKAEKVPPPVFSLPPGTLKTLSEWACSPLHEPDAQRMQT